MSAGSLGIVLGPFALSGCIGRGGMGEVWAGEHGAERTPVAVKVITDHNAADERFRAAFRNEVRAVAGLDHPGVVTVFDFGQIPAGAGELPAGSP